MDGEDQLHEFLNLYNRLHEHLRELTHRDERASFGHVLRDALRRHSHIRPFREQLETFVELRNVLVHRESPRDGLLAVPTEETLESFRYIVSAIENPTRLEEFRRSVRVFDPETRLAEVLRHMGKNDYSQVIVRDGTELRLVTAEGIASWLQHELTEETDAVDMSTAPLSAVLPYEEEESYLVLSRHVTVAEAVERFRSAIEERRPRLYAIIITENGRAHETPLGIATPWDLLVE